MFVYLQRDWYPSYGHLLRRDWFASDPNLIEECLFAFACVLAFLQLFSIFTVSPKIGPLQISFGRMIIDIAHCGSAYAVLILAFSCGISQVYYFYTNSPDATHPGTVDLRQCSSFATTNSSVLSTQLCPDNKFGKFVLHLLF